MTSSTAEWENKGPAGLGIAGPHWASEASRRGLRVRALTSLCVSPQGQVPR